MKPLDVAGLVPPGATDIPHADPRRMNREEAARQFESYLAQMMVKEMRNTLPEGGLFGSKAADMFAEVFDQEIAKRISDSGRLGLQKSILARLGEVAGSAPEAPGRGHEQHGLGALFPGEVPVVGGRVSSGFGRRHDPFHGDERAHHGVDIAAPEGTSIQPVRPGTVAFAGRKGGFGNVVIVDHGGGLETVYAHCERLLVQEGQPVAVGQPIATVGQTGRATGPHVHVEARLHGAAIDPAETFGWRRQ
ncbi:MAG: peptidoglycan DD-metalloendopeptidase family protein [Myxococcota bacterium]|nr:peptidoglycan DD-metalloendopeptidase family protein [Myxococcota bacterium]